MRVTTLARSTLTVAGYPPVKPCIPCFKILGRGLSHAVSENPRTKRSKGCRQDDRLGRQSDAQHIVGSRPRIKRSCTEIQAVGRTTPNRGTDTSSQAQLSGQPPDHDDGVAHFVDYESYNLQAEMADTRTSGRTRKPTSKALAANPPHIEHHLSDEYDEDEIEIAEVGPSTSVGPQPRTTSEEPVGDPMLAILRELQEMRRDNNKTQEENARLRQQMHDLAATVHGLSTASTLPASSDLPVGSTIERPTTAVPVRRNTSSPLAGQRPAGSSQSPPRVSRSARFPDPPLFEDGTPAEYDRWRCSIVDKLEINDDWFPYEKARCAYIRGRLSGRASDLVIPWIRQQEGIGLTVTVASLMGALDDIFVDRNAALKARSEAKKQKALVGRPRFTKYVAEFMRLANIGGLLLPSWKEELHEKITGTLRVHLACKRTDPTCTFNEYVQSAKDLEMDISSNRRAASEATPTVKTAGRQSASSTLLRRGLITSDLVPKARENTPVRQPVMGATSVPTTSATTSEAPVCYTCKQAGHFSKNCPRPQTEHKATDLFGPHDETTYEVDQGDDLSVDAEDSVEDSGNGSL